MKTDKKPQKKFLFSFIELVNLYLKYINILVMRALAFFFKAITVILISVICLRCDVLPADACDSTAAPEISVSIQASVHIRGKNNLPMKDQRIRVTILKEPCGAATRGEVTFEGLTDAGGNFNTTVANYNLRNTEDKVSVDALGRDIVIGGNSSQNFEYVSFRYNDFIVGTIKNVDITLYTNQ